MPVVFELTHVKGVVSKVEGVHLHSSRNITCRRVESGRGASIELPANFD